MLLILLTSSLCNATLEILITRQKPRERGLLMNKQSTFANERLVKMETIDNKIAEYAFAIAEINQKHGLNSDYQKRGTNEGFNLSQWQRDIKKLAEQEVNDLLEENTYTAVQNTLTKYRNTLRRSLVALHPLYSNNLKPIAEKYSRSIYYREIRALQTRDPQIILETIAKVKRTFRRETHGTPEFSEYKGKVTLTQELQEPKRYTAEFVEDLSNLKYLSPAISLLKLSRIQQQLITDEANLKLLQKHERVTYFEDTPVIKCMADILTNHRQNPPEFVLAAIALATGRRKMEVLTARFTRSKNKNALNFSGQLKTKLADKKTYEIPVLIDREVVLDALRSLKKNPQVQRLIDLQLNEPAKISYATIHKRIAQSLDRIWTIYNLPAPYQVTSSHNGEEKKQAITHLPFKFTRNMYAAAAVARFKNKNESEFNFYHRVLGHEISDPKTTLHYMSFQISSSSPTRKKRRGTAITKQNFDPSIYTVQQSKTAIKNTAKKIENSLRKNDSRPKILAHLLNEIEILNSNNFNWQQSAKKAGFRLEAIKKTIALIVDALKNTAD